MMLPAEVATPASSKTELGQNDFNFRDHDFSELDCGLKGLILKPLLNSMIHLKECTRQNILPLMF